MRLGRFSLSNLSIKHRLPPLIGTLLLGIITASTWASYRGVKESAFEVGRERLLNLTLQLATVSQQSAVIPAKTYTAANDPGVAFSNLLHLPRDPAQRRSGSSSPFRTLTNCISDGNSSCG